MASSKESLFSELKKATKRANQRLVRLEQQDINSHAYKIALNNINKVARRDNNRFIYNKKMSINALRKELKITNQFLNSTSSTKRGIDKAVKSRLKETRKSLGLSAKTQTALYDYTEKEWYTVIKDEYGSKQAFRLIGEALDMFGEEGFEYALTGLIGEFNEGMIDNEELLYRLEMLEF